MPPRTAFQLWCLGEADKNIPPFRDLQASDMGNDKVQEQKNKRRRLADLRSLMSQFEEVRGKYRAQLTHNRRFTGIDGGHKLASDPALLT